MNEGFTKEQARFLTELVILTNYPEAKILEAKYDEGLSVSSDGILIKTMTANVTAYLPVNVETITINFTMTSK